MAPWVLVTVIALLAAPGVTALGDTAGVGEARVETVNGMPRLLLDGKPTVPFIFFYNTDVSRPGREDLLRSQMQVAMAAGCHIYSLPLRVPRLPDSNEANYAWPEGLLDRFIAVDPAALFLVRVYPGPDGQWKLWKDFPPDERAAFADGSVGNASLASETYQREFLSDLRAMVRHFEDSPYGRRIIAWQPGGPEHEMFGDQYRDKGPDTSGANQRGFRQWLAAHYADDAVLRRAWGRPDVSLATARIPSPEPGRFPMHGGSPVKAFYDQPAQQDWVDFSRYSSDLAADRIISWARAIKEETGGKRLSAFFYGYTMELPGSFAGHYALHRVLDCPEVDILAGPCSYSDRRSGDPPSPMSLMDTIAAHGKLWFNEDDMRTNLMEPALLNPEWEPFNGPITTRDLGETEAVLERNFASIHVHRAGTWWMDLMSVGAFNHPDLGRLLARRVASYQATLDDPEPYRAEVAVVVDEGSKCFVSSDWDVSAWALANLRTAAGRCGAPVAWCSLDDVVGGVAPPCRAYVFANAFWLDAERREALLERLRREGSVAVWVYAPGYLGGEAPGAAGVGELTGIEVAVKPGTDGSVGCGLLEGEAWGMGAEVVPRLAVVDGTAEALGHYRIDGLVSAAHSRARGYDSYFIADLGVSVGLLRKVLGEAGVWIWADGGEVVQTDGRVLSIHAAEAGEHTVHLPPGVVATAEEADVARMGDGAVTLRFARDDTQWLWLQTVLQGLP